MYRENNYLITRVGFLLSLVILLTLTISSCGGGGGEPEKTPQEIAQELLLTTWTMTAITLDGSDVSESYPGFSITIGDGTFSTTNAGELFPSQGTWNWVGDTDNMITTGRGKTITITTLSASAAVLSFLKTSANQAAGLSGSYVITFSN